MKFLNVKDRPSSLLFNFFNLWRTFLDHFDQYLGEVEKLLISGSILIQGFDLHQDGWEISLFSKFLFSNAQAKLQITFRLSTKKELSCSQGDLSSRHQDLKNGERQQPTVSGKVAWIDGRMLICWTSCSKVQNSGVKFLNYRSSLRETFKGSNLCLRVVAQIHI